MAKVDYKYYIKNIPIDKLPRDLRKFDEDDWNRGAEKASADKRNGKPIRPRKDFKSEMAYNAYLLNLRDLANMKIRGLE